MEISPEYIKLLGFYPKNPKLFIDALTHPANPVKRDYERLEFLGDAVLDTIVGYYFYQKFPKADEGVLTLKRRAIVNGKALKYIANKFNLLEILKPYNHTLREELLENALDNNMEALIAAIFIERGFDFTYNWFSEKVLNDEKLVSFIEESFRDFKSELLRKLNRQAKKIDFISEPLNNMIKVSIFVDDRLVAEAVAKNRKDAEQISAKQAMKKLNLL